MDENLSLQRRRWLRAAQIYYLSAGEDSGMGDYEWDAIGRTLYAHRDQFPECPVLSDPEYQGGSLFWVTDEKFNHALTLY